MATQLRVVAPPTPSDKDLKDFSAVVQSNFEDLFRAMHSHRVRQEIPTSTEGAVGDIILVNTSGSAYKLYAKVTDTQWLSVSLT